MESKSNSYGGKETLTPMDFIEELWDKYSKKIDQIEVSTYLSGGQGITVRRVISRVDFKQDIVGRLNKIIDNLDEGEELALHSSVYSGSNKKCIPLIDFSFRELDYEAEFVLDKLKGFFREKIFIYSSGRSYHGYVLKVINQKEWREFLGGLLLFNKPDFPFSVIDSRWVGHSLEHGFSALRISHNSKFYLSAPRIAKFIDFT